MKKWLLYSLFALFLVCGIDLGKKYILDLNLIDPDSLVIYTTILVGFIGLIHFFLNHFDTVYLHGFDSFNPKYDTIDYFKPERPNHFDKDSKNYVNTPDHSPLKEKQYIEYVTNNHNIKFL